MFTFTPLAGAQSTSRASQSILELDGGVKILVDVGWDERFDTRQLAELEKHVSTLSFILLTHATISHLGAFAHCSKHVPLFSQVPVYATAPVIAFGRTLLQDLYTSAPAAATFIPGTASPDDDTSTADDDRSNILREAPTFEEINKCFSNITPLKYSQPHQPTASYFSAPLEGLTLSAYNAGHTLGGTIWHIQHGMESIVYAVDWHQAKENVIDGAAWFEGLGGAEVNEQLRSPTALVCSSTNGDRIAISGGTRARDEALVGHIKTIISKGGTVLIPTDSSARMLELSYLLEKVWQDNGNDEPFASTKVYMASRSAQATLRHARSLLEWMNDNIVREFEGEEETTNTAATTRTHQRTGSKVTNGTSKPSRPFEFKHIKVVETASRLAKICSQEGPKVIIASDSSLEWGHARAALEHVAQKQDNLVILTEHSSSFDGQSGANVQTLWLWHQQRTQGVSLEKSVSGQQIEQIHTGEDLIFFDARKAPLDAAETARYQQFMATQRQMQDSLVTADGRQLAAPEDALDEDDESSSESEDEEDERQGRALNVSAALTHGNRNKVALTDEDLGVNILLRKKDVHDYDVRNKKGRNAVFPYTHSRRRIDEFGEIIKPEDFLREEEKDAQENVLDSKNASSLGQKRKWSEPENNRQNKNGKRSKGNDTDIVMGNNAAVEDGASDESDSEDETEPEAVQITGPCKIVYDEKRIPFKAKLAYVDFTGIHDQRSLQMLIPLIGPKKLILVGGTEAETSTLTRDCRALLGMKVVDAEEELKAEIYSPQIGQVVDASVDTNAWIVKLTRDLAKRLQWQNVKSMSIVTVTGQLRAETAQTSDTDSQLASKKLKLEDSMPDPTANGKPAKSYEPILDTVPITVSGVIRSVTHPIHVGDLRLADLRRLMRESGHQAVFRGEGTLLIDDMIAVRKLASGRIVVEGSPINYNQRADSFAQVRQKIYDGLAVVAAG